MAELPLFDTRRTRLVPITTLRSMHRLLMLSIVFNMLTIIWLLFKWQ
jgi:hypothetical protein